MSGYDEFVRDTLAEEGMSSPSEGEDQEGWIKRARIATVLGSCPKSHASFKSGLLLCITFCISHFYVRMIRT